MFVTRKENNGDSFKDHSTALICLYFTDLKNVKRFTYRGPQMILFDRGDIETKKSRKGTFRDFASGESLGWNPMSETDPPHEGQTASSGQPRSLRKFPEFLDNKAKFPRGGHCLPSACQGPQPSSLSPLPYP